MSLHYSVLMSLSALAKLFHNVKKKYISDQKNNAAMSPSVGKIILEKIHCLI